MFFFFWSCPNDEAIQCPTHVFIVEKFPLTLLRGTLASCPRQPHKRGDVIGMSLYQSWRTTVVACFLTRHGAMTKHGAAFARLMFCYFPGARSALHRSLPTQVCLKSANFEGRAKALEEEQLRSEKCLGSTNALERNESLHESPTTYLDKAVKNVSRELSEACLAKEMVRREGKSGLKGSVFLTLFHVVLFFLYISILHLRCLVIPALFYLAVLLGF